MRSRLETARTVGKPGGGREARTSVREAKDRRFGEGEKKLTCIVGSTSWEGE
jgi:hypothetical protein